MGYIGFLAWSQLSVRPWQSTLLVLTVSIGVMILTTALSLTNGFEKDMVDRLLGTTPHVSIYNPLLGALPDYQAVRQRVLGRPHVVSVTPFIQGQGLLTTESKATVGVIVRGVSPTLEAQNPTWRRYIVSGGLRDSGLGPGVLVGTEVARKLGVGMGDRVWIVTGLGQRRAVTVSGLFESGLFEFDAHVAFLGLPTAQAIFGLGSQVTGLSVQVDDVFGAPGLARELADDLMLGTRAWSDQNRPLLQAMFVERVVIFIVIMFIVLVAMIGVGSTMAMWVIEKNREISLLRAIGVSANNIGRLFMLQGTLISVVGVLLGSLGGFLLSLGLAAFPIGISGEVYFLSHLPVHMQAIDFAIVATATLLLSPVASILPALRAMRLDPIVVIRRT